jgi:ribosome biogenesis GTPase A
MEACGVLDQKLTEMTFKLVAAGQFKRGKSSVINALLGESVLPTGVVPLTSIVTAIRFGARPTALVQSDDGREHTIEVAELPTYVTEVGNPRNERHVKEVTVDHPSGWLAQGFYLVDTPGIGSVYHHNTDVAQQYLPQADAVLFIASVDQPLGTAELEFLSSIRQHAEKIFCLLNKTDYLDPAELAESVNFAQIQIRATLGTAAPLFPVSAKQALQGKLNGDDIALSRSGFPEFELALRRFMVEEQSEVWCRSVTRALLRILSQLRFTLELEAKLLIAPQTEIEQKLRDLRREKVEVQRVGEEQQVLLEAAARTLLIGDIEPALTIFKVELQQRITKSIPHWYADLTFLSSRDIREALEEKLIVEIRTAYDGWLTGEDARVRQAFGTLCSRSWGDLQAAVDELMRYSSALFALDFEAVGCDSLWTSDSDFYYKFWYEPTGLAILSASFVLALPKTLAGRLIVKRTQTHAMELIEAQAGRIRHDLDERLKQSVRDARREINRTAESIVDRLEGAIESGMIVRRNTRTRVNTRTYELAQYISATNLIEARVRALPS